MEILPQIQAADVVITDPPYGINFDYSEYKDTADNWFTLMDFLIPWIRQHVKMGILPSCKMTRLQWIYTNHPPDWLICWYKGSPGHRSFVGFNDWEPLLVYGKNKGVHMHDHFTCTPENIKNGHPCPKPIGWAKYLISRTSFDKQSIVDPFMGSGTTGVACAQMGRKFIGIEIDQKYFDIACRRIDDASRQTDWIRYGH